MARPKCARLVDGLPGTTYFKPRGIPLVDLEEVVLSVDEFEALRLADFDGLYHENAAARMFISRATFGRILESAHKKVADSLINGKAIKVEGGVIKMAQKRVFQCSACEHTWEIPFGTGRPEACPQCSSNNLHRADSDRGHGRGGGGGRGAGCRHRHGQAATSTKETT
ncbi:hypothetical protein C3F09_03725 [candidate division GN15 bacterium]|uniref:UPF0251 protein C3F09_03725 n=1 Tax=candidate division GN15 bacterium TaxID=2072418 RepID=A0A855X2V8_9BACT|nr:MAG: hypothetical protein C3F09_03725 [candidate division GN15 bacterium]